MAERKGYPNAGAILDRLVHNAYRRDQTVELVEIAELTAVDGLALVAARISRLPQRGLGLKRHHLRL